MIISLSAMERGTWCCITLVLISAWVVQSRPPIFWTPVRDPGYPTIPIQTRDLPFDSFARQPTNRGFRLPTQLRYKTENLDRRSDEELPFPGFRPFKEILVNSDRSDQTGNEISVEFEDSGNSFLGFFWMRKSFRWSTSWSWKLWSIFTDFQVDSSYDNFFKARDQLRPNSCCSAPTKE